ncbi:hypothetical protein NPIL_152481 [Nephila pilipes]|uniref:Uncharacterized protein n=1 Tax=Nephila pilipes TaxID=299642 RepID=A0A8X6PHY5_NEPPI|nr:hypothetical protein NPIL_152481 [Nephila pilipes]
MRCLFLLFLISTVLLIPLILIQIFEHLSYPKSCICSCPHFNRSIPEITTTVIYKGIKNFGHSCLCEDFLIPQLKFSLPLLDVHKACESCRCEIYGRPHCDKDGMNTKPSSTIILITICLFTGLLIFVRIFILIFEDTSVRSNRRIQDGLISENTTFDQNDTNSENATISKNTSHLVKPIIIISRKS